MTSGKNGRKRPMQDIRRTTRLGFTARDQSNPVNRIVSIPAPLIAEQTKGFVEYDADKRDVCLAYVDEGGSGCSDGLECLGLHVDKDYITRYRKLNTPVCCGTHGDTFTEAYYGLMNKFTFLLEEVEGEVEGEGKKKPVPTIQISSKDLSLTEALIPNDLEPNGTRVIALSDVCRKHLAGSCRFSKECRYIHLCRTKFAYLAPEPTPAVVEANNTSTTTNTKSNNANTKEITTVHHHAPAPMDDDNGGMFLQLVHVNMPKSPSRVDRTMNTSSTLSFDKPKDSAAAMSMSISMASASVTTQGSDHHNLSISSVIPFPHHMASTPPTTNMSHSGTLIPVAVMQSQGGYQMLRPGGPQQQQQQQQVMFVHAIPQQQQQQHLVPFYGHQLQQQQFPQQQPQQFMQFIPQQQQHFQHQYQQHQQPQQGFIQHQSHTALPTFQQQQGGGGMQTIIYSHQQPQQHQIQHYPAASHHGTFPTFMTLQQHSNTFTHLKN
eukprot:PhF_6_TR5139/c5_g1_i2/m.7325